MQEIIDQIAHFVTAFVPILFFAFLTPLVAAALTGMYLGFIRETAQHDTLNVFTLGSGAWLDIIFWTLGGLAAGLLFL